MNKMKFWVSAAVLCLFPVSMAVTSSAAPEYTVGDFAVNLAKMITQKSEIEPEDAVTFLGKLGVELQGELDSRVSEQALTEAFNQLGLSLTTSSPDRTLTAQKADHVFQMFDRNDTLFAGELFKTCQTGSGEPHQCITDADCADGHACKVVQSIRCQDGPSDGDGCMTDADCPMGVCKIPPGQKKKLDLASPSD